MKPTTNIYILADCSLYVQPYANDLNSLFIRYERLMRLSGKKVKMHFIRYNDKAQYFNTKDRFNPFGNPNLAEGLKLLKTTIEYQRKYDTHQTRSIFLLFTSGNAMLGWKRILNDLYCTKEFTTGLRYVITTRNSKYFTPFTDRYDRLLPYFSENRLSALVNSIGLQ